MRLHEKRAEHGCEPLTIVRPSPIVKKVFALLYVFAFARVVGALDEALPKDGVRPAWISSVLTAAGI